MAKDVSEKRPIEANDTFYHKNRHSDMCRVEYVSVDGSIGYRILGTRRIRYSTEKNFRKNWTPVT